MKPLILLVMLLSACSQPAQKSGETATQNNATNNTTNATNNATVANNLPAGACAHAVPISETATTCRTDEECSEGCGYVDYGPGCGAQQTPPQECNEDIDCGEGRVCEPAFCSQGNTCCEGEGTQCLDACSVTPCEDGFDCGDDGHCTPTSCEDGFSCADGLACDPARSNATIDGHGCTPEACLADGAACPDGMMCDDGAAGNPNGTCVPIPCGSDDDCHPNEVCNTPASIYATGCELDDCSTDADCACGACIAQKCQPRIFVCLSPPAP